MMYYLFFKMYEGVIIDVEGMLVVESVGIRNCELVVDVSVCL